MTESPQGVFDEIYGSNAWGYGSGHGSLPDATAEYRRFLQDFIHANGVRSVLDYGCGDWQFSQLIDWHGASYLGVDVVKPVIEANRRKFGTDGIDFLHSSGDPDELPSTDLLIAKDVLQHLPNAMVAAFLTNVAPRFPKALLVNCTGNNVNRDIEEGQWRPLDLRAAPFYADGTVIATLRGPRVRPPGLRGRFQKGTFNAWTKQVTLLLNPMGGP